MSDKDKDKNWLLNELECAKKVRETYGMWPPAEYTANMVTKDMMAKAREASLMVTEDEFGCLLSSETIAAAINASPQWAGVKELRVDNAILSKKLARSKL